MLITIYTMFFRSLGTGVNIRESSTGNFLEITISISWYASSKEVGIVRSICALTFGSDNPLRKMLRSCDLIIGAIESVQSGYAFSLTG